jgi:dihydroflavonol-4-reductase
MKKALVTGGCGFLGSSIVRHLLERDVDVRVLALPNESSDNVDGLDIEIVHGNVLNMDDCKKAVKGVDTVFHAAAIYKAYMPDPTAMYDVNLSGTFNMLEAARRAKGVEKTIYTASIVSLGRPKQGELGNESTQYEAWNIDFSYSRAKYHSRVIAEDFAKWGQDVRVVCPGVVLGPRDITPTPSGQLILNMLSKQGPPVYVDGGANYVDVRDAALVHVLAAENGAAGERYLATAHNLSNAALLNAIQRATGGNRKYRKIPAGVARFLIRGMEKAAKRKGEEPPLAPNFFEYSLLPSYFSNRKSVTELGATFRPLSETLRDAIGYFQERGLA